MTYNIKTYNAIDPAGLNLLEAPNFSLDNQASPDGIILRSENLHILEFGPELKAISRAGAGVNNIPVDTCTQAGIVVFNTPGANANAVKELVLASLLLSVRPIIKGATWVQTLQGDDVAEQVEREKKQFGGSELEGKKLGVIGLGAIGAMIANDAYRLGMDVYGYDPFVSVDTAWNISRRVHRVLTIDEVLTTCDFVTIHIPLNPKTTGLIGKNELALMKPNSTLLNFSRGELVEAEAVVDAIEAGALGEYIVDFAEETLLGYDRITVLPHLGASTAEAEINCAKLASKNLKLFLETGNIQNAVNFPNVQLAFHSSYRIAIFHQNVPNMLGTISSLAAKMGLNIDNLINRSREDLAYTLLDVSEPDYNKLTQLIALVDDLPEVRRARLIKNKE